MSAAADWWTTSITDMKPGRINLRSKPIQYVIGNNSFSEMIRLMVCGEHSTAAQA